MRILLQTSLWRHKATRSSLKATVLDKAFLGQDTRWIQIRLHAFQVYRGLKTKTTQSIAKFWQPKYLT